MKVLIHVSYYILFQLITGGVMDTKSDSMTGERKLREVIQQAEQHPSRQRPPKSGKECDETRRPQRPAPPPHEPASGGRPPVPPPAAPSGGGGEGGGNGGGGAGSASGDGAFTKWRKQNTGLAVLLGVLLLLGFILLLNLMQGYFQDKNLDRRARRAAIEKTQTPPQASPAVIGQPSKEAATSVVSSGKQSMIRECGRQIDEEVYKVNLGCFYFENTSSSVKKAELWTRHSVRSIESEYGRGSDGKQFVSITALDGTTCTTRDADNCSDWVREKSIRQSDGFIKFTIHVPPGQRFIANILS